MTDNQQSRKGPQDLGSFEPGGELGPVESHSAREERLNRLPPAEKQLAEESARFADLSQYFEQRKMDVPADIIDQLRRISRLAISERIEAMKKLNQRLMEYLSDAGENPVVRQ